MFPEHSHLCVTGDGSVFEVMWMEPSILNTARAQFQKHLSLIMPPLCTYESPSFLCDVPPLPFNETFGNPKSFVLQFPCPLSVLIYSETGISIPSRKPQCFSEGTTISLPCVSHQVQLRKPEGGVCQPQPAGFRKGSWRPTWLPGSYFN